MSGYVGPAVSVFDPLVMGDSWVGDLTPHIMRYSHAIKRYGGFYSAEINISGNVLYLEDWFLNGLGRRILSQGAGGPCWEGFVDRITYTIGSVILTRGPLTDMCNRARVIYAPLDTSTNPPTVGERTETTITEDLLAQTRYGVLEKVLSIGNVTTSEAEDVRDVFLRERAYPDMSQEVSVFEAAAAGITLSCLGYIHLLNYPYNQTVDSGLVTVTDKLQTILDDSPNPYIWYEPRQLYENLSLAAAYEDDYTMALTLLDGLVKRGDGSAKAFSYGVYDKRQFKYFEITDDMLYQQHIHDPALRVTRNGINVPPWEIRPAWMLLADVVSVGIPNSRWRDPHYIMMDAVTYEAPYKLRYGGSKLEDLAQRLSQIGLGDAA